MGRLLVCFLIFCSNLISLECQSGFEGLERRALQQMSARDGVLFLETLIEEIHSQFGVRLNISDACRILKANIDQLAIPSEVRENLHLIADSFGSGSFSNEGLRETHAWKFGSKKRLKDVRREELVLPDKLAAGFACAFAGALLCIVPGGQSAGFTLIGTGLALAVDGMSNGERPSFRKEYNFE